MKPGIAEVVAIMFAAWNAPDEAAIRAHAERALTADVEFVDPWYDIRGIDAWVGMVTAFRADNPSARPRQASGIDMHHDRARYAWAVEMANGTTLEGFDVVVVDPATGKLRQIVGFFGPFPPLDQ